MKYLTAAVCLLLPGLASAAPPSTIPDLIRSLQDTNLAIRMKAIRELGELGTAGRPAVPELCRLLRED
jgi:HEAT repeat protein